MTPKRIFGIVLILLGAAALYLKEISYTTQEDVVRVGPMQAQMETRKTVPLHRVFGGAAVALGVALLLFERKK
jgi:uncharacterized protein YjeT (DUF2065 family)